METSLTTTLISITAVDEDYFGNVTANVTVHQPTLIDNDEELKVMTWVSCGFTSLMCMYIVMLQIGYRLLQSARSMVILSFLAMTATAEVCYVAGVTSTDIPALCTTMAAMFHFSCVSCSTWFLSYILFLGNKLHAKTLSVGLYAVIGWGIPACFVIISLVWRYQNYRQSAVCWISSEGYLDWALKGPVIVFTVLSFVILLHILRMYLLLRRDLSKAKQFRRTGIDIVSCIVLLPVMGLTWSFGIFSATEGHFWLRVAFAVANIVMGGLLFCFMCVFNQEIQVAREKYGTAYKSLKERLLRSQDRGKGRRDIDGMETRDTTRAVMTSNSQILRDLAKRREREMTYHHSPGEEHHINEDQHHMETSLIDQPTTSGKKDQDVSHLFQTEWPDKLLSKTGDTNSNFAGSSTNLIPKIPAALKKRIPKESSIEDLPTPSAIPSILGTNVVKVRPVRDNAPIAQSELITDSIDNINDSD